MTDRTSDNEDVTKLSRRDFMAAGSALAGTTAFTNMSAVTEAAGFSSPVDFKGAYIGADGDKSGLGAKGWLYFTDDGTGTIYKHDGSGWVDLGIGGGSSVWEDSGGGIYTLKDGSGIGIDETLTGTGETKDLTDDGGWCWFQDPRALRHVDTEDQTYAAWVSNPGDIEIGSYDHNTGEVTTTTLSAAFNDDDHVAPGLVVRPDGKIIAFWSDHNGDPIYYKISSSAEDISSFGTEQTVSPSTEHDYENPRYFGSTLYLFYRNGSNNLAFITSSDDGSSWSSEQELSTASGYGQYFKISQVENGRVDIALTHAEGNTDGSKNDVRHIYFDGDTAYASDGTSLGSESGGTLPISHSDATAIWDTSATGKQAWVWDCATHGGTPEVVYAQFDSREDHNYRWARYENGSWTDTHLTDGGMFITTGARNEFYYSGGIALDHDAPGKCYLSAGDHHSSKIQRWTTGDGGETWKYTDFAGGTRQNVRPVVPRNAHEDLPVTWMKGQYNHFSGNGYETAVKLGSDKTDSSPAAPLRTGGVLYAAESTLTVPSGSYAKLTNCTAKDWDIRDEFVEGGRYEVSRAGLYLIWVRITFDSVSAAGEYGGRIVTGSGGGTRELDRVHAEAGESPTISGWSIDYQTKSSGIEAKAWQNSGSDQTVSGQTSEVRFGVIQLNR